MLLDALDPLLLSRIQFAFTVSFHFLFPAFTIGLASYLAVLEGLWLWTKEEVYHELYQFWLKIFAVSFGMGVVSGIVMSYQFGTNWSRFSDGVGAILGPVMSYEVLTAFFLEAGFLGIMLFGLDRVGRGLHLLATCLVALGTFLSTFWIISANSWMHTPTGYAFVNGRYEPANWFEIVFNPSFPYRLTHVVLAAYLTTAFVVGAVGAWHLLKGHWDGASQRMFSMAMWMAALVAPIQIMAGDMHGLNTLEYQPAKIAAMEGHFETQRGAPLILFGLPDMAAEETHYKIEIPKLGSLILGHSFDAEIKGLKAFPPDERPNASIIFWTFRVMVGIGFLMMGIGLLSLWLRWRGQLFDHPLFLRLCVAAGPLGFIAVLAGWFTTEIGRQPWVAYGLIRTADARSPLPVASIATSLTLFVLVYCLVFGTGFYYLLRLMRDVPSQAQPTPREGGGGSNRPLSGADKPLEPAPAE